jgi:hypothetical protein
MVQKAQEPEPSPPLPLVPIADLEEYCRQIGIGKAALRLLQPELSPWAYLGRLLINEKFPDAIRLLALLLPKRLAVWWGCLCVRQAVRLGAKQQEALDAAVRWVRNPSPANSQAAEAPGKAAGFATAAGCLAMSVSWARQSLTPPDQPSTPPDLMLTPNTVTGVILTAATEEPTTEIKNRQCLFLALGLAVANQELLWSPERS